MCNVYTCLKSVTLKKNVRYLFYLNLFFLSTEGQLEDYFTFEKCFKILTFLRSYG